MKKIYRLLLVILLMALFRPSGVTIESLTDTQLIISLHWDETTLGQGRVRSVEGDHTFEFEVAD